MEELKFRLRSYGWTELAICYNPALHPDSASRLLRGWIKKNEKLTNALEEAGFLPRQRKLTPRQVSVIIAYLGEP